MCSGGHTSRPPFHKTPPLGPLNSACKTLHRPIYHITHVDNLPGIVAAGRLVSDAACRASGQNIQNIGYQHIKDRRMQRAVDAHPGSTLGQYVPFYFCRRSVMLYVIHRGHEGYQGGQDDIVHLVSTVQAAVTLGRPWAFSDRHADLAYAEFSRELTDEARVDWSVMDKTYWSDCKEERQAEFLVRDAFPLAAVAEVVCHTPAAATRAREALAPAANPPAIRVERGWYY